VASFRIKPGVSPWGFANILAAVSRAPSAIEIVITSGTEGQHKSGSLHYKGHAADIRRRNFPSEAAVRQFMAALKSELGEDYDVILEADHIHCEYDPD
jgi:hypothetical protein